ncbi:Hydantoinase/oxoprolinase N-terminal region-domain-containing protein [Aspergillus desertorum]
MANQGGYRLGADVGGTFTDIYAFIPDNKVARAKVPTTVEDQSVGIKNGIRKVQQTLKDRFALEGKFQFIHHGTTVATNAVLEGKGARTGLIVTSGHKDILSVRRSQIPGGLGAWLHYTPPDPIVPLERVIPCKERMSVDGESVVCVDVDALRNDLKKWANDEKPEAVAISLLNSHCNSKHEVLVAGIVREMLGEDVTIILSSDVLREVSEYERTLTTCTNALVKPVVQTYLSNLQDLLADDGNMIRILKSDGGLTSLGLAGELPVNILMSGPAGGVQGNLITFDMGGTSTDVAIIHQGKPQLRRETVVGSLTVRSPAVDIRTVGAGGGSIAKYMSITETMRVGPESAGATPGPACYNKGGREPTVRTPTCCHKPKPPRTLSTWSTRPCMEPYVWSPSSRAMTRRSSLLSPLGVQVPFTPMPSVGYLGPGQLLVPPSPGTLCALGNATTGLSHSQSLAFIRRLSATTSKQVKERFDELEATCKDTMANSNGGQSMPLNISYHLDLRYRGQALNLTVELEAQDLLLEDGAWRELLQAKFDQLHEQQFKYCLPNFELELMRLEVVSVDASPGIGIPQLSKAESTEPPADALVSKKQIVVKGQTIEATLWDREKISRQGMDSNTLILPGCYGEIDPIGNILIHPSEEAPKEQLRSETPEAAKEIVQSTPLISTLVASALASIRSEMDTLMLRCSKMLVGQFGSFITQFLRAWKGTIEEGDMFITNDTYMIEGAVTHLNDVILYTKGTMNTDVVDLLCRNSRQHDWYRTDLMAIIAACRTASSRVCELIVRFGCEVYLAACNELLMRNRTAMMKIFESDFGDEPSTFTDFVDDDGHGVGPWALTCTMTKIEGNRLLFDWDGTSPQSDHSINFYLSETMFRMFIGYYMIASAAPGTVINDGFHDLIDIHIPQGSILKPALIGMKNPVYAAAASFSDSPHFFYSAYKPDGEWYQLYQIGFGGVPARNAGDGLDCHCLFPAIKSIPTEIIELNYPLRIEANESVPDSGGSGFYRGGNAQRTNYRFLARGEFSIHDDRWFTKPWGIRGGKPEARSKKTLYRYSKSQESPPVEVLPSKCDHIRVDPDDLLEWITWGGGGLVDPLTRPAEKVALEVRRRLVTIQGARDNYGVAVNPESLQVDEIETEALRKSMMAARSEADQGYDRGGSLEELKESCLMETGLPPPNPQWEQELYGPHVALPYVQDWYSRMKEVKGWVL